MRQRVPKRQRAFARTLRANATNVEIKFWRLLRSRRLASMKFPRQVPIGAWIVDFVSFEHRLIIEADAASTPKANAMNGAIKICRCEDSVFCVSGTMTF